MLLVSFGGMIEAEEQYMNYDIFYVNDVLIESKPTQCEVIYVNGVAVESNSEIQARTQDMLIPLRTIFESLGATVIWQEETENILIKYNNESYLCYTSSPNSLYPTKYLYVKNLRTNKNIYLTSMSYGGAYCIINDRTYLYSDTGKRLLEAMGCKVEFELNTRIFKIVSVME